MGFKKQLPGLFVILDVVITFISLRFFSPHHKLSYTSLNQDMFSQSGYSFTRSPYDFIVFLLIRSISIGVGTILVAYNKESIVTALCLPCLGFSISVVSFSIIKLLAFSEHPEILKYPGLWFILAWTIISSTLFCILWHVVLSKSSVSYMRLFNSEEQIDGSVGSSEDAESGVTSGHKTRMSTFKHIIRLLQYCFLEWPWFIGGFSFLFAYSAIRIFIPYYTGQVIANIVHSSHGMDPVIHSVIIMGLLTLSSAILGGFRGGCFDYGTSRVLRRVRRDLFAALVKQDIAFFDVTKTGELLSRLTSDCTTLSDSVALNLNVFLRNLIMLIGALVFMFNLSWRLALVNFIAIPINIFITKVYGSFFDKLSEKMQDTIATANHTAEEVLSTMRTVRSFGCENKETERFEKRLDNTLSIGKKRAVGYMGKNWSDEFTSNSILVGVLAYGGYLTIHHRMSSENFISFLMYQMQLGENLYGMGLVVTGLMQSVGASRKVFEYINRVPSIANDGHILNDVQGDIKIDSISFKYPSRPNNPVLKNLSLDIKHGETIALVGPSGGGKSSIVSLIEHFYEPEEGEITLDGLPIRDYNHIHYHQKVSLVSQEPILYDGSVKHNIAYGCEEATEEDIIQAAKTANVHNFVMQLDKGYDTNCGEKGVQMSGGQKQRIAIARALIRNPSVLILDEATSALDSESENIVQEALQTCSGERTVIIIAHRLSTIEKANRIAVINNGAIVQIGSHNELMEDQEGLYYSLVNRQVKHGI